MNGAVRQFYRICGIRREENVNYAYKHRFGIFRFYNELPGRIYSRDEETDLMEVIMVDLRVLNDKVQDGQNGHATDDEKAMLESIYNIQNAIEMMEQVYEVDLTSYEKGVRSKMSLMGRLAERERELEEQKRVNEEQNKTIEQLKRLVAVLQGKMQLS